MLWMVFTSLKIENEVVTKVFHFFPQNPTLANYIKAFSSSKILRWMLNSAFTSAMAMILTLVVDAPIAYAFAKIRFKGRNILFWAVMAGMMVPFQVLIIPLYLQFNSYGLINTMSAVYLPRIALPIGIFIMKQFFEGIPDALEEAAFIDGASRFRIFSSVILPLGKTAFATVTILSFTAGGHHHSFLRTSIIHWTGRSAYRQTDAAVQQPSQPYAGYHLVGSRDCLYSAVHLLSVLQKEDNCGHSHDRNQGVTL